MDVDGRALSIARIAHEADHVTRLDLSPVDRERREGREVCVVELVAGTVAEPETVAAEVVPADRENGSVRDREQWSAERRKDVDAVVPAHDGSGPAVRVGESG